MKLIDGKKIAKTIEKRLKEEIRQTDVRPGLAALLIGNDAASHLYVRLKEKACKRVGINFHKYYFEENTTKEEIKEVIQFLNKDTETDGILVQLPLPNRGWEDEIITAIDPLKDVDGFHKKTIQGLLAGKDVIKPGLAEGILLLIKSVEVPLPGKKAAILCNNEIFATPIAYLLKAENVDVNVFTKEEPDLEEKLSSHDILVVAIGKKNFVTKKMVKKDAIIIDVGINRIDGKVYGDVDIEDVEDIAGYITPVPGGVGPMTVAMLLKAVFDLHKKHRKS